MVLTFFNPFFEKTLRFVRVFSMADNVDPGSSNIPPTLRVNKPSILSGDATVPAQSVANVGSESPKPVDSSQTNSSSNMLLPEANVLQKKPGVGSSSSKAKPKLVSSLTTPAAVSINLAGGQDDMLEQAGLSPRKSAYYINIIKRYLTKMPLTEKDVDVFKRLPTAFVQLISTDLLKENRIRTFAEKTDSVLKVTLFLKNEKVKNLKQKQIQGNTASETTVNVFNKSLNYEVFKIPFYFVVLQNDGSLTWSQIAEYLNKKLFTTFLSTILPSDTFLESIETKVEYPKPQEPFTKALPIMEYGELDKEISVSTTKVFAFSLLNSSLLSSRNQYLLKFPFICSSFLDSDSSASFAMSAKANEFAAFFSKPFGIALGESNSSGNTLQSNVVLQLAFKTTKMEAIRSYWVVDNIIPVGFINSRATVKNLDFYFNKEVDH